MSFIQKFLLKILPKSVGDKMRTESESWQIRCETCDFATNIWDAGGIRWGAASKGKKTLIRCPKCNGMRSAAVEKKIPEN